MVTGKIDKGMLKPIRERVMFELVKAGTSFNPQVIKGIIEIAFEEAEKLGLVELIGEKNKT